MVELEKTTSSALADKMNNNLCYIFINTLFIPEVKDSEISILKFGKNDIDGAFRDIKNEIFSEDFEITITYTNCT